MLGGFPCIKMGCQKDAPKDKYYCKEHEEEILKQQKDLIEQPNHYTHGGIEVFDIMKAKMSKEAWEGYCQGNIIKYMLRFEYKGGVEDLKKAQQYLKELIKSKQGE